MTHELDWAKYIAVTSFKRDGTGVSTPTWVIPYEGGVALTTEADSFKVKRIRNNPKVMVSVSDIRGKVAANAKVFAGTARILDRGDSDRVRSLVKVKYRVGWLMFMMPGELTARVRRQPKSESVGIAIELDS